MDLYLIRHADAKPLGEDNIHEDAERPLSDKGHDQARSAGAALRKHGVKLTLVVTSPLLRARQTAEGLLSQWSSPAPELLTSEYLAPKGRRRKLARYLTGQGSAAVAVVGHMPHLGGFAAWLLGAKDVELDMAKAGVAYFVCPEVVDKGSGKLTWLVTPEWLK